jgi:release factor glutamine methyltransferase
VENTLEHLKRQFLAALTPYWGSQEAEALTRRSLEWVAPQAYARRWIDPQITLSGQEVQVLQGVLQRLAQGEPLQYIAGEVHFAGMTLKSTPAALIPRPETEELANLVGALKLPPSPVLLDIGTGSGCLILAAGKSFPSAELHAIDYSSAALELAKINAQEQRVAVHFHHLDFLNPQDWTGLPSADLIISNPPYVAEEERTTLLPHVLDHEPHMALFAGSDPLVFYKAIAGFAAGHLSSGGYLALEINAALAEETLKVFQTGGMQAEYRTDVFDRKRFIIAQKPS